MRAQNPSNASHCLWSFAPAMWWRDKTSARKTIIRIGSMVMSTVRKGGAKRIEIIGEILCTLFEIYGRIECRAKS